jgi:hypothetical protein
MVRVGNWIQYKWGDGKEYKGKVLKIEYDDFNKIENKDCVVLEKDYGESSYRRVYIVDIIGICCE